MLFCGLLLISATATAQVSNLSGIKICIDPGHGGYFAATDRHVIPDPGIDFWESESNFQKALLLKSLLEAKGAQVLLTRNTNYYPNDEEPGLSARVALANANNVSWFHSIHSNAGGGGTANYTLMLVREKVVAGGDAVYGPGTGQPQTQEAWDISKIIGPNIVLRLRTQRYTQYLDWTFYGGSNGGYTLGVLRGLNMPGQLSEGSFHDNLAETRRLMNNSYRKMEAYAIRDAFMQYFNVPADTLCIVAGILTERGTNKVVNLSQVRILPENRTYTGDVYNNGFYMFDSLVAGPHTIICETPGFWRDTLQVTLTKGSLSFNDRQVESTSSPVVLGYTPANRDTLFAASGQIKFIFSKIMDTALVRKAFSITPFVKGTLNWSVNNTTLIFKPDSVVLPFNTTFIITIDTLAKSESGLTIDGNADGISGDPFTVTFKTKPVDAWAPKVISTSFSASKPMSPNGVINITFDEPLNPATVNSTNVVMLESRTIEYYEVNGKGGINVYLTNGFTPGKTYKLRLGAIADKNGNAIPLTPSIIYEISIAPLSNQITTLEDFNTDLTSWWQPSASGSTAGMDSASFTRDVTTYLRMLPNNTASARLSYTWKTSSSSWLLREYLGGGAPRNITWTAKGMCLQTYLFGDGSGTPFRFAIDDGASEHEVSQWVTIDWVGWRLVEWDLENDSVGSWIGNGKLDGTLRFDSYQLKYEPGSSTAAGAIYLDQLQLVKSTLVDVEQVTSSIPTQFALLQNYPNPFNPSTTITFAVPSKSKVTLKIFDLLGREAATLVDEEKEAGTYRVVWNAGNLSSGVYYYRCSSGDRIETKKMMLLR
ncbi:MAG: N-acetylmuramoyl-L-alanine amidase [bacterium]